MWVSFTPESSVYLDIVNNKYSVYHYEGIFPTKDIVCITRHKNSPLVDSIENMFTKMQNKPKVLITQSKKTKFLRYYIEEDVFTKGVDDKMHKNVRWKRCEATEVHKNILNKLKLMKDGNYKIKLQQ